MNWPSISIAIPSFNQGEYIERTLLSILRQDYDGRVEVIVADGGSTDRTVDVLKKYQQIAWWSEKDRGFVDAVTKGMRVARGEVLAIQSSDDYYLRDAFGATIGTMLREPDLHIVSGCEVVLRPGRVSYPPLLDNRYTPRSMLIEDMVPQHTTFFRRHVWEETGGLREQVDMCADIDFWYRSLHSFNGRFVPRYTAAYQVHQGQRTQVSGKWLEHLTRMIESCEGDPRYGSRFRMSPADKRNYFCRLELGHLLRTGDLDRALEATLRGMSARDLTRDTRRRVLTAALSHPGFGACARAKLMAQLARFPELALRTVRNRIRARRHHQDLLWWSHAETR